MIRQVLQSFSFSLLIIVIFELLFLTVIDLGPPPLYINDEDYEYIYAPNQNTTIFHNRIITNEYSMRSNPLFQNDSIRIVLIGDSIINGENLTDHDDLASSLLEDSFQKEFGAKFRDIHGKLGPRKFVSLFKQAWIF